jgi:membrane protein YdbS with pleckstrin-like domain
VESLQLDIASEDWILVDKAYLAVLRIGLSIFHGLGIAVAAVFIKLLPSPAHIVPSVITAMLACSFLWWFFIWAPRSTKRMRYLLREQDINLQRGFMFWKMVSVSCNRIQHLEVRQGPIERRFDLATLVIYTAGTQGSDLKIPGLTLAKAQQLKSQLLNNVNAEEADVAEPL